MSKTHPTPLDLNKTHQNNESYCFDLVRKWDHDRFLTTLFIPSQVRRHWLTILALNVELSMIRDAVTEPTLGHIRFQWWHDRILSANESDDTAAGHPVLLELRYLLAHSCITPDDLTSLIPARDVYDLIEYPFATLSDLRAYLEGTAGALQVVLAKCLVGAPMETSSLRQFH